MKTVHCIDGSELDSKNIIAILDLAQDIKNNPEQYAKVLQNKQIALLFEKPSLRTRLTFTTGIQAMGGSIVNLPPQSKREAARDIIRVIQQHCDALVVRTHEEAILYEMRSYANIPIINGLSKRYHPCQILADLLTLREHFGRLEGLSLCFIGDGNNVLRSLMMIAPRAGLSIHAHCIAGHEVHISKDEPVDNTRIRTFTGAPEDAVSDCSAVYTDVWQSMGCEPVDESKFVTVSDELMQHANDEAVFMHCLPAYRGKEVTDTVIESERSLVFRQSENRQYVQQALLYTLIFNYLENIIT